MMVMHIQTMKNHMIEHVSHKDNQIEHKQKSALMEALTDEHNYFFILNYFILFMSYGVARMMCQGWMWQLHFYPVLGFSGLAIVMGIAFAIVVAPMLPVFAALMAMPPHMDDTNLQVLEGCKTG